MINIRIAKSGKEFFATVDEFPDFSFTAKSYLEARNKIVEAVKERIASGTSMEYIGAYRNTWGKMCCAFQELIKNANNSYHRGKIFSVENDVVFEFQENGERIARRKFDGGT